jgi:hypothetical protein
MPKLVRVLPERRIEGLANRDHPVYGYRDRMTGLGKYRCPFCEQLTVFGSSSDNLSASEPSPFPAELKDLFDMLTPSPMSDDRSARDFYCRICQRPVRVVYQIVPLFHHDCFDAECVIEFAPTEDALLPSQT